MVDVEHVGGAGLVIDAVADPVLATPSPPLPFEGLSQRRSYSAGIVGERAEDELDACRGDRLGKVLGKAASIDSRSSAATSTTYSRPFLVMRTRSWVVATSSAISDSRALTSDSGSVVIDQT